MDYDCNTESEQSFCFQVATFEHQVFLIASVFICSAIFDLVILTIFAVLLYGSIVYFLVDVDVLADRHGLFHNHLLNVAGICAGTLLAILHLNDNFLFADVVAFLGWLISHLLLYLVETITFSLVVKWLEDYLV